MKELPLTGIQRAYLMGRDDMFELNGISTHVYYECETKYAPDRFEMSFNKLIQSQPMLRAIFHKNKGTQTILDEVPHYRIAQDDWRGKSQKEIESLTLRRREMMSHMVFDVEKWPLFEISYARMDEENYCLFLSFDLLITDGKSLADLMGMIMDEYEEKEPLPVLDKGFEDYILAKEKEKHTKRYENCRQYWLSKADSIADAPHIIDSSDQNLENVHFRRLEHFISAKEWSKVKEKLKEYKISPSIGTMAAYCAVLGYWSNQDRFTLNSPVMSIYKRKKELSKVVGDFTEAMLIPAEKYDMKESFISYMKRLSGNFMESFKHNTFDGIDVMNLLRNQKAEKILMPVVFTSMLLKGDSFSNIERLGKIQFGISQTPQVYLDCQLMEREDRLSITWDYVDKLFDKEKLEQMFEQFIKLILRLKEDTISVEDILTVPEVEKEQLTLYNHTFKDREKTSIGMLLEKSFEDGKLNPAVRDSKKEITYEELDAWSNGVAAFLKKQGIQRGQRVGILSSRCIETVVNIVGVIKCGAVYVPIDPNYPENRQHYIYQNSNCIYLLESSLTEKVSDTKFLAEYSKPEEDAYVIYTSGSTGTPKGVVISNDAVCNTILNVNGKFQVSSQDKLLGIASFGFDLSVYDILGALSAGAELVICEQPKDIHTILENLEKQKITIWNSVPAIMELLLDSVEDDYINHTLRSVFLSGDWIPLNLADRIRTHFPESSIISLGGATEGSIWSIYYPIMESLEGLRSVPYGYPMENQQMYVLDSNLRQLPYGVEGEIYIGGRGVACGYENDEERTRLSYINHPAFGKIYKTGDYGMMTRAGYMEFRGRKDSQVKIRGYRIELAEIDKAITELDGIQTAVTDVYSNSAGGRSLVSYVVAEPEERLERKKTVLEEMAAAACETEDTKCDFSFIKQLNESLEKACTAQMKYTLAGLYDWEHAKNPVTASMLIEANGLKTEFEKLLTEWMKELAGDGYLKETENGFFLKEKVQPENPESYWNVPVLKESKGAVKTLCGFIKNSCEQHRKLLNGELTELALFFPKGSSEIAQSMYKYNPISKYVNEITQNVLMNYLEQLPDNRFVRILELGAGIGGSTSELFDKFLPEQVEYTFTDITDLFLHNAQKLYGQYDCMKFGVLDINEDFQVQGYEYGHYDIVIAANVLHDAVNLNKTIQYISNCLTSDGVLFLVETTKNLRSQMTSVGFIEGFSDYEDERLERNRPLLNTTEWEQVLSANGMQNVQAYPCKEPAEANIWQSLILSTNAYNRKQVSVDTIQKKIADSLPDYMIPGRIIRIPKIPLSDNGKVNRKELPKIDVRKIHQIYSEPQNEVEKMLAKVWGDVLGLGKIGICDDFFELGGDSLKAITIVAKAEEQGYSLKLADIFSCRTIEELEKKVVKLEIVEETQEEETMELELDEDELELIRQASLDL